MDTPVIRLFGTVILCDHGVVMGVALLIRYSRATIAVRLYRDREFALIVLHEGRMVMLSGCL